MGNKQISDLLKFGGVTSAFKQNVGRAQTERYFVRGANSLVERVITLRPFENRQHYAHHLVADQLAHLSVFEHTHLDKRRPETLSFSGLHLGALDLFRG